MRILVCVKSVPKGDTVPLDPDRQTLRRDKAAQALNPADCAALEQAFRLKERHGGSVTALSMGPPGAERLLREICALPVDKTVLVTDPLYAGSDSLATARVLAAAAKHLGGFDLILLGRRAIDGETGHVGPELAALLGIASCVTNITGDCAFEAGSILCARLLEDSLQSLRVPLPAVLTICGGEYALRPPSIAGLRTAKPVSLLTNAELGLPPGSVGLTGSPTHVAKTRPARESRRAARIIHDAPTGAEAILEALHSAPVRRVSAERRGPAAPIPGIVWVVSLLDDAPGQAAARELVAAARDLGAEPLLIRLRGANDVACARALAELAAKERPETILLPATIRGRCVAPYCAALLQTGLTADCTELGLDGQGQLRQVRPAFGGGIMAEIYCRARPQMATVRPGVFAAGNGAAVPQTDLAANHEERGPMVLSMTPLGTESLSEAGIIIAGGKGIGGKEGFSRLENLAGLMRAAVGASRSAVDAGYAPYIRQIGQTGTTVRPGIYIAFAISGTVQHLAGMRDSGLVIAVNTDPKAPIFSHADIGIVASWEAVAEAVAEQLARKPR